LPREAFLEKTEDDRYARGGFAARSSAAELDRMRRSVRGRDGRLAQRMSEHGEPHRREIESPLARSAAIDLEHLRDDSIECDVSRTGVPVMVRESYYPNWRAEGADGPWRSTPDFMVVVPTSRHVRLTFATTPVEWLGRVATVLGVVGLGLLIWWGRRPASATEAGPGGGPGPGDGGGDDGGGDPDDDDLPDRKHPTVRFRSPFRARSPS